MRTQPHPEGVEINPHRPWGPQDVQGYSAEVVKAMNLLEPLLQAGLLALVPDQWSGGKLTFLTRRELRGRDGGRHRLTKGERHTADVLQVV